MKKQWVIAITVILLIALCACGSASSANVATIKRSDGKTEELTFKQLLDIKNSNSLAFDKNYYGATVTVEGKITELSGPVTYNGAPYAWRMVINSGDGSWIIGEYSVNKRVVSDDFLASLSKGDTVKITGVLISINPIECDISNGVRNTKVEKISK